MKKQLLLIALLFMGLSAQAMMSSRFRMNSKLRRCANNATHSKRASKKKALIEYLDMSKGAAKKSSKIDLIKIAKLVREQFGLLEQEKMRTLIQRFADAIEQQRGQLQQSVPLLTFPVSSQQAASSAEEDADLGLNILFGEDNSEEPQEVSPITQVDPTPTNSSFFARHKWKFGFAGLGSAVLGGALFAGYKFWFKKKQKENAKNESKDEKKALKTKAKKQKHA